MSHSLRDLNSLNILQGDLYLVLSMRRLNYWGCLPDFLLVRCVPCTLLDHGNHDPLLDIPKQFLLPEIDTFQYWVQLLVPVRLVAHAIPHTLLTYHLWHIYAFWLPLVS